MSGCAAAFAGILYAGRMGAGRYTFGDGDELTAIAAVILGGTSMAGGTGFVIGALAGSLLMGMINNGLILGGLSVSQQTIVRGVIIILAVALSNISRKKK
jgi:ribose transport system permease protein